MATMTHDYVQMSNGRLRRTSPPRQRPNTASVPEYKPLLARTMTRRRVLRSMAGVTGAALSSGVWMPAVAQTRGRRGGPDTVDNQPKPIPGGFEAGGQLFHAFLPGTGNDESTIFDFNGALGSVLIRGQGTNGEGIRRGFHADIRFMQGVYVAVDGNRYTDTFAFV